MNGHNTDSEAHLQGQFWLRGGSPDLREKHTECMYGRALTGTKEQRAPSLSSSSLLRPHCLLLWQPPHTPNQEHLQPRCTGDTAATLEPIPKGKGWSRSRGCFWPDEPEGKDRQALQTTEDPCKSGDAPAADPAAPFSPLQGCRVPSPPVRTFHPNSL